MKRTFSDNLTGDAPSDLPASTALRLSSADKLVWPVIGLSSSKSDRIGGDRRDRLGVVQGHPRRFGHRPEFLPIGQHDECTATEGLGQKQRFFFFVSCLPFPMTKVTYIHKKQKHSLSLGYQRLLLPVWILQHSVGRLRYDRDVLPSVGDFFFFCRDRNIVETSFDCNKPIETVHGIVADQLPTLQWAIIGITCRFTCRFPDLPAPLVRLRLRANLFMHMPGTVSCLKLSESYNVSAATTSTKQRSKCLTVCHVNVRSLSAPTRLVDLEILCANNSVDILCLSETWLSPSHSSSTRPWNLMGSNRSFAETAHAAPMGVSASMCEIPCLWHHFLCPLSSTLNVYVSASTSHVARKWMWSSATGHPLLHQSHFSLSWMKWSAMSKVTQIHLSALWVISTQNTLTGFPANLPLLLGNMQWTFASQITLYRLWLNQPMDYTQTTLQPSTWYSWTILTLTCWITASSSLLLPITAKRLPICGSPVRGISNQFPTQLGTTRIWIPRDCTMLSAVSTGPLFLIASVSIPQLSAGHRSSCQQCLIMFQRYYTPPGPKENHGAAPFCTVSVAFETVCSGGGNASQTIPVVRSPTAGWETGMFQNYVLPNNNSIGQYQILSMHQALYHMPGWLTLVDTLPPQSAQTTC